MLKPITIFTVVVLGSILAPIAISTTDSTPETTVETIKNVRTADAPSQLPIVAPATVKLEFERTKITTIAKPKPVPKPKKVVVKKESSETKTATTEEDQNSSVATDSRTSTMSETSTSATTDDAAPSASASKATTPAEPVIVAPGSAQAEAKKQMTSYGWGADQLTCLASLWTKESGWNHTAENPSSGAYGIPQSLPGNKMASAGSDWKTNPATQIKWGLGYIAERYKTPCGAWAHSVAVGWY